MRSIFAGLAVTVALSLGACGQKAAGSAEGKECKELFEKFDGWCKDAAEPTKSLCEGKKADLEKLKKTPDEQSCTALAGAIKATKDLPGAVPAGDAAPSSAPAGDAAPSSAPAGGAAAAPTK